MRNFGLEVLIVFLLLSAGLLAPAYAAQPAPERPDAAVCLGCHGNEGFAMPGHDGKQRSLHVVQGKFEASVHGKFLSCVDCHQGNAEIPHKEGAKPKVDCGMCHAEIKQQYLTSVHGKEAATGNTAVPGCPQCHTKHDIQSPKTDAGKLAITQACGSCHTDRRDTYIDTYHGQVNTLGYAYTAKCFDCHGSHGLQRVKDPSSSVHPDNRLQTCQKCHTNATAGFVTFEPHANTHDFARFPYMWLVSKFMIALLAGVFAFFWLHTALWFYREFQERKAHKARKVVIAEAVPKGEAKHFQRFAAGWRVAHLLFAISVMTLVLTGMAVFYGETAWAKALMNAIGGPRVAALAHRVSATLMLGIFFVHLVYVAIKLGRQWRTFNWFGPDSLVPNLKDLADVIGMFKWFFGLGPRPQFERWAYWEKFDYWAVFWGMGIIGGSGMMLAFPNVTASVLPGWVFNVAALVHGEEAFLAAVFLFTVHFFNNHFRPEKFPPPDIVMFTGAVSLEEFKREHRLEYERLAASGELSRYLVDAPSRPMTIASRVLGLILITIGLTLLMLVATGFVGDLRGG